MGFNAIRKGLEPSTSCVTGRRSNQLNYRTNMSINFLREPDVMFSLPSAVAARSPEGMPWA